jgi:hypothetical protein
MKYIFKWYITDGYTYGYDLVIPFECDDLLKFIYEAIEKVQSSEYGCEILGIDIHKDDIDNIEHSFFTLEEWFERNKFIPERDSWFLRELVFYLWKIKKHKKYIYLKGYKYGDWSIKVMRGSVKPKKTAQYRPFTQNKIFLVAQYHKSVSIRKVVGLNPTGGFKITNRGYMKGYLFKFFEITNMGVKLMWM